jgi:hypothetical protein
MANRVLRGFEKKQRGCQYCLHVTTMRHEGEIRNACPFDKCPFEILAKYKTYEEFMASEDSKIFVTEYFSTLPSYYELGAFSHAPKGIFEDKGDFKMHL